MDASELPALRTWLQQAGIDPDALTLCLEEFKTEVEHVSEERRVAMESPEGLLSYLAARDLADAVQEILKYLPPAGLF